MKLRDFVKAEKVNEELYSADKEFEEPVHKGIVKNDEKEIPNEGNDEKNDPVRGPRKVVKNACAGCGKPIKKGEYWMGDMMGRLYHRDCFDEKFGNLDPDIQGSQYPEYPEVNPKEKADEIKFERSPKMAKSKEPKKEVKKPVKTSKKSATKTVAKK